MAWQAKETLRGLYDQTADDAATYLAELVESLLERDMPPELRQLGWTLRRWRTEIVAWHRAQVSNGPTEAMNNLIKAMAIYALISMFFANSLFELRVVLPALLWHHISSKMMPPRSAGSSTPTSVCRG